MQKQYFIAGFFKFCVYVKIVLHIVFHFGFKMFKRELSLKQYLVFLCRAYRFLLLVKEDKIVKRGNCYKLHLYIPAYPTKAFFYSLEKLYKKDPAPITVVFSMTKACKYNCPHCYQGLDSGKDLDEKLLIDTARHMQDVGVSMFDIEGGEPLLRFDRLVNLIESLDERAEVWINTTGQGLTEEMVKRLKQVGLFGVMISLHSPCKDEYDNFVGVEGAFDTATNALNLFYKHGVYTAINNCAGDVMLQGNKLDELLNLAKKLNCAYIQFIHEKSSGLWLGNKDKIKDEKGLVKKLCDYHIEYNRGGRYKNYPAVSAQVYEEREEGFGCTAGGVDRFYLGASGEVQPCEFLNISFGNVNEEDFAVIYKRMREVFKQPCQDWLCCKYALAINELLEKNNIKQTPVPWSITKTFIEELDRGSVTRFYEKLGIYKR